MGGELSQYSAGIEFVRELELKGRQGFKMGKAEIKRPAGIIFHDDEDGICSAVLTKILLERCGFRVDFENIMPVSLDPDYGDLKSVEHVVKARERVVWVYVDVRPFNTYQKEGDKELAQLKNKKNHFCIDHHEVNGVKSYHDQHVLLECIDTGKCPTTTALLVAYLLYLQGAGGKGEVSLDRFLDRKDWILLDEIEVGEGKAELPEGYKKYIVMGMLCDNLWGLANGTSQLNSIIKECKLKGDVDELEKTSIAISIILGKRRSMALPKELELFFEKPKYYDVEDEGVERLMKFCDKLIVAAEEEVRNATGKLEELLEKANLNVQTSYKNCQLFRESLRKQEGGRRRVTKGQQAKLAALEEEEQYWKQRRYHLNEVRGSIFPPKKIPAICVIISEQPSGHIKGILASLLYYSGRKRIRNIGSIVMEDKSGMKEFKADWGSRGLTKEKIEMLFEVELIKSPEEREDREAEHKRMEMMEEAAGDDLWGHIQPLPLSEIVSTTPVFGREDVRAGFLKGTLGIIYHDGERNVPALTAVAEEMTHKNLVVVELEPSVNVGKNRDWSGDLLRMKVKEVVFTILGIRSVRSVEDIMKGEDWKEGAELKGEEGEGKAGKGDE